MDELSELHAKIACIGPLLSFGHLTTRKVRSGTVSPKGEDSALRVF